MNYLIQFAVTFAVFCAFVGLGYLWGYANERAKRGLDVAVGSIVVVDNVEYRIQGVEVVWTQDNATKVRLVATND